MAARVHSLLVLLGMVLLLGVVSASGGGDPGGGDPGGGGGGGGDQGAAVACQTSQATITAYTTPHASTTQTAASYQSYTGCSTDPQTLVDGDSTTGVCAVGGGWCANFAAPTTCSGSCAADTSIFGAVYSAGAAVQCVDKYYLQLSFPSACMVSGYQLAGFYGVQSSTSCYNCESAYPSLEPTRGLELMEPRGLEPTGLHPRLTPLDCLHPDPLRLVVPPPTNHLSAS
jgi:hypothetical protein